MRIRNSFQVILLIMVEFILELIFDFKVEIFFYCATSAFKHVNHASVYLTVYQHFLPYCYHVLISSMGSCELQML